MADLDHDMLSLTRNQSLVLSALQQNPTPLTAYALLDQLKPEGLRAPPQIYRALEKLQKAGLIHRLESLNAFVACTRSDCSLHRSAAFSICDKCGDVREFNTEKLDAMLAKTASQQNFELAHSTIELRGMCSRCR